MDITFVSAKNVSGENGAVAPKCGVGAELQPLPEWVKVASLVAQAAGLAHDFGKANVPFQEKLFRKSVEPVADAVRHEWLSMRLLQEVAKGRSSAEAWTLLSSKQKLQLLGLNKREGLTSPQEAVQFLVGTHHRLFGPRATSAAPNHENHFNDNADMVVAPAGSVVSLMEAYEQVVRGLSGCQLPRTAVFWRAISIYARAALIFADHAVSATLEELPAKKGALYAKSVSKLGKGKVESQTLESHLSRVAALASVVAAGMSALRLPALSQEATRHILEPSTQGSRFEWQNRVVAALERLYKESPSPTLVFNVAGTGAGKTRMNAKCACILAHDEQVRFSVALNQRSLTLQTGSAMRREFGIGRDELAVVVGDVTAMQLHEAATGEDDRAGEEFICHSSDRAISADLPAWVQDYPDKSRLFSSVLQAPILVSTIDFIVAAGDLTKQGTHVGAMLRLLDSDVVLDEVDSYDEKAMVAILRLVQMVGFSGKNLICSSATLAAPLADAIYHSYRSGIELRAAMTDTQIGSNAVIVDNVLAPTIVAISHDFGNVYRQHLQKMSLKAAHQKVRIPYLQKVADRSEVSWLTAVKDAAESLHDKNKWHFAETGKTVSFGLVRVANIRAAIKVARHLAKALPQAQVAAYHSQDLVIQRFLKERRLDQLLSRKSGNNAIEPDVEIKNIVASAGEGSSIPFIVVATPVEEVGRDHDFDWAVIEPSSSQSLVQTAGRVNRHRLVTISAPNIAILQHNMRWAKGKKTCFQRPGLESHGNLYDSHDLEELLDWGQLEDGIDARLRFGDHRFAKLDDTSIEKAIARPLMLLSDFEGSAQNGGGSFWMTHAFYQLYPLRSGETKETWLLDQNSSGDIFKLLERVGAEDRYVEKSVRQVKRVENDWLTTGNAELRALCDEVGISHEEGMRFQVVRYYDKDGSTAGDLQFDQSFGFWVQ